MNYRYKVYGLTFDSEIEFPELFEDTFIHPDVRIILGEVPDNIKNPTGQGILYKASANDFLFRLDSVAKYRVQNGNTITVQPIENSNESEVRLFLFGSSIGALFFQREMLALHGSAINSSSSTIVFTGASAAGKSTLAAGFLKRGYSTLTDDISVINLSDPNNLTVYPGIPHLKLWGDTLKSLNLEGTLTKIRPQMEKYRFATKTTNQIDSLPLKKVILLETKQEKGFTYQELFGGDKINALNMNTYRTQFVEKMNRREPHFNNLIALAKSTQVYRVERPLYPFLVFELVDFISNEVINA